MTSNRNWGKRPFRCHGNGWSSYVENAERITLFHWPDIHEEYGKTIRKIEDAVRCTRCIGREVSSNDPSLHPKEFPRQVFAMPMPFSRKFTVHTGTTYDF